MLNPVRIYGTWDEGIVLDNHMLKSIFLGYDEKYCLAMTKTKG